MPLVLFDVDHYGAYAKNLMKACDGLKITHGDFEISSEGFIDTSISRSWSLVVDEKAALTVDKTRCPSNVCTFGFHCSYIT